MATVGDDAGVGRLLTRREALALIGGGIALAVAGCSDDSASQPTRTGTSATRGAGPTAAPSTTPALTPTCVVKPELTEGPFFVDEHLQRSDIRTDTVSGVRSEGAPLGLTFVVSEVGNECASLAGAVIDVWQCDASGAYSDVRDPGFDTTGKDFLRGSQTTDSRGQAYFSTIYPGWYTGRAVHIHFKIRAAQGTSAQVREFTSQLFFDDTLSDRVLASPPYSRKIGSRTLNADDSIFRDSGGQLTLKPAETKDGLVASFAIGLQA